MKLSKLNQKGFSLVELMVVVAIIGILATIGIPQYQKFMAKARQSEAKTHLNAVFQGEASFFTEYNNYTVSLKSIGAGAVGQNLRYNAGFAGLNACAAVAANMPPEDNGTADTYNDLTDTLVAAGSGATWAYFTVGTENDTGVTASICTQNTFTATAWGNPTNVPGAPPNNAANNLDRFTIDQQRLLSQTSVGL